MNGLRSLRPIIAIARSGYQPERSWPRHSHGRSTLGRIDSDLTTRLGRGWGYLRPEPCPDFAA
jgi:hypothetical protein